MNIHTPLSHAARLPWQALAFLALLFTLTLTPRAAQAQSTRLSPQAERITDEVIQTDHRSYDALQGRIKALNERGRPVAEYFMAKAQCWLDVSFHEYTRNDRSDFPQAALSESAQLVQTMEAGGMPDAATPLVNGAARLRADLWGRAAAMKPHAGFRCAQQKLACAEVELVHAGNEEQQQGWRHAKPYVQIAEDLFGEAAELAVRCPAVVTAPAVSGSAVAPGSTAPAPLMVFVPAPVPLPVQTVQTVQLQVIALFNFDKSDAGNLRSYSLVHLQDLVRKIQSEKLILQSIQLNGHADRLNSTGQSDYNLRLSEKRVATVKAELLRLGLPDALISTQASGDKKPIPGCEQRFTRTDELRECLLPNRRVDVLFEARRP